MISVFELYHNQNVKSIKLLNLKNMLAQDFYDKRHISIIYNGVDTGKSPAASRKRNSENINILFVSHLIERKGLQLVIPKLRKIQEKSHKNIRLIFVGGTAYLSNVFALSRLRYAVRSSGFLPAIIYFDVVFSFIVIM